MIISANVAGILAGCARQAALKVNWSREVLNQETKTLRFTPQEKHNNIIYYSI